jgi:ubiquinone/menaquinone biosynthesis C-methylase UbiE
VTGVPTARMANPFDAAAAGYDEAFEHLAITQTIRGVVLETLFAHFAPGSHVLELNCGTGTDAIALAERGVHVTCIDSSEEMIACARAKVSRRHLEHLVSCRKLDFEEIDSIGGVTFDGVFSNFGGLNCSPRLRSVAGKLVPLLKPGSVLVATLLNRTSLWETAAFIARGKFSKAFRRLRPGGADAVIGGIPLHVWYYSPGALSQILNPWFTVIESYGLSILSPPPNASNFLASHPVLTGLLVRLDANIRSTFPFRSLGDHFVVVARRVSE